MKKVGIKPFVSSNILFFLRFHRPRWSCCHRRCRSHRRQPHPRPMPELVCQQRRARPLPRPRRLRRCSKRCRPTRRLSSRLPLLASCLRRPPPQLRRLRPCAIISSRCSSKRTRPRRTRWRRRYVVGEQPIFFEVLMKWVLSLRTGNLLRATCHFNVSNLEIDFPA